MTTAQLVFLYAASELNISKAAQRTFVSQQCASNHIKNLEQYYGMALFTRKPTLALTPAGQCLYAAYQQLHILERNTDSNMAEIRAGSVGTLRVGMNPTRSRILIPAVLPRYSQEFPRVQVNFQFGDTLQLMEQLQAGTLDLVIGIGVQSELAKNFQILPISQDSIYFLTTAAQIEKYAPNIMYHISNRQLSLIDLAPFPFCRNYQGSTLTNLINNHLNQTGISLNTQYYVSDYDIQLSLCRENATSCFCPSMILKHVFEQNQYLPEENQILSFSIQEIADTLSINLIQMRSVFQPFYVKQFIKRIKEAIQQIQDEIHLWKIMEAGESTSVMQK